MELIEKLRKNKKLWLIIFCAALGVGLLLLGNNTADDQSGARAEDEALAEYSKEVEKKIYEICSQVKGVSDVSVAVSFESGFETVYARNYDKGDLLRCFSMILHCMELFVIICLQNELMW